MNKQQSEFDISMALDELRQVLPPVFTRTKASELLGGIISAKTLANLGIRKEGPPAFRSSRHVIYQRESFLAWLSHWLQQGRKNGQ